MADNLKKQEGVALNRTAEISLKIREAISAALPAPAEQHLTVMVPGKVIKYKDHFDADVESGPEIRMSQSVEVNNARLCDDMPALSTVQLGPTNRSVSRSYSAALTKLVPAGSTVGVDVVDPNSLSDAEQRYQRAMVFLKAEDERNEGKSHLDTYIVKQRAYTAAEEKKIKAFNEAYNRLMVDKNLTTKDQKLRAYEQWVSEHARKFRNEVEGAYKDWVVHGRKEEVEYWFAVVDNDSAMSRVEMSKEAMRGSTVIDKDGVSEYYKVFLDPSDWAKIAQDKCDAGATGDQKQTVEWYTWEIVRLRKCLQVVELMKKKVTKAGSEGEKIEFNDEEFKQKEEKLSTAMATYREKDEAYKAAVRKAATVKSGEEKEGALKEVDKASADRVKSLEDYRTAEDEYNKATVQHLSALGAAHSAASAEDQSESLGNQADEIQKTINLYEEKRETLLASKRLDSVTEVATALGIPEAKVDHNAALEETAGSGEPKTVGEGAGNSNATRPTKTLDTAERFTPISIEISSSSESSSESQSSSSTSASVKAGWTMFGMGASVGASASHSESSMNAEREMANCSMRVSMEVMRVDINRPWLRSELFYDKDLRVAEGNFISPGFYRLKKLMSPDANADAKTVEEELDRYSSFPMFPTAFLLAANVVLELTGETAAVQSHFNASSTTAGGTVSYGPVSVSASHSNSKSEKSAKCETTANGCRITIGAPQIIGWVSQIIPELPRRDEPGYKA